MKKKGYLCLHSTAFQTYKSSIWLSSLEHTHSDKRQILNGMVLNPTLNSDSTSIKSEFSVKYMAQKTTTSKSQFLTALS